MKSIKYFLLISYFFMSSIVVLGSAEVKEASSGQFGWTEQDAQMYAFVVDLYNKDNFKSKEAVLALQERISIKDCIDLFGKRKQILRWSQVKQLLCCTDELFMCFFASIGLGQIIKSHTSSLTDNTWQSYFSSKIAYLKGVQKRANVLPVLGLWLCTGYLIKIVFKLITVNGSRVHVLFKDGDEEDIVNAVIAALKTLPQLS